MLKPAARVLSLPGTKASAVRSLLLASTGVITLDPIIGGGIPVGSIVLAEEDEGSTYSKIMLKSFLSEGVTCNHPLFIASQKVPPQIIAKELMPPIEAEGVPNIKDPSSDYEMKIAWRYQNNPQMESSVKSSTFGHVFDLSQTICDDKLLKCKISYFPTDFDEDTNTYEDLYLSIENIIMQNHHISNPKLRTVLRIGLHGLGSNLWGGDIILFLYKLQNLIKSSYACVFITLTSHCMESYLVSRCEHLSDVVFKLDTLPSGESNPLLNEYHGLFHIVKQSSLNSLGVHIPDSNDWGFKLKRRRFIIEKLHLPPELQESKQREQDDLVTCGSGGSKKSALDF